MSASHDPQTLRTTARRSMEMTGFFPLQHSVPGFGNSGRFVSLRVRQGEDGSKKAIFSPRNECLHALIQSPNLIRRIRRAELARIIAIGQSSDLALFGNYCRGAVLFAMWERHDRGYSVEKIGGNKLGDIVPTFFLLGAPLSPFSDDGKGTMVVVCECVDEERGLGVSGDEKSSRNTHDVFAREGSYSTVRYDWKVVVCVDRERVIPLEQQPQWVI
ncbi:hypothetical protein BGW80DRAFT_762382 [Lactifluus volemus]|nr:hypothetical protein BGW80DRAFT_762382 [Lactifluus volemus]